MSFLSRIRLSRSVLAHIAAQETRYFAAPPVPAQSLVRECVSFGLPGS
ncbi:hypothetical protein BRUCa_1875 [Brucella melitensis]|uniref:Uncharacterized protein n=1 Tax=Brucella ovis (strain ATCC 25840 / 63/290 / NCTC 10512) TaxID=444178 RepID=A0A0H3ARM2_BRUO2|nr:hypothetical protein BOV_1826 [Brucella ovis ATCC 25840]ADZ66964.1 conserved hypothetical protein [Brucella melitensis M28]AEW14369.1 hypothetical protein BCA52141_I2169 [Brucella canis HSK A52141]AEW16957.1 hypothetical protein BAA13334_I00955 [Brucella abortus A13334]AIB18404.1 Hypothetical protein BSSP3_I1702 [Brucella suis bv. 2]EFG36728.1 hypothetical protein BAZG_00038 [Brucella sp. NVSL 07-0026]EFM57744.1 Hypothetical protein BIBO1_0003 [Brucella inopinata BO1]EFM62239.1 Hypothetic